MSYPHQRQWRFSLLRSYKALMTLDQFITECQSDVAQFKVRWEAQHANRPQEFPSSMEPGDWFDQFIVFLSSGTDSCITEKEGATNA